MQPTVYVIAQNTHSGGAKSRSNYNISRKRLGRCARSLDRYGWKWREWSAVDGTLVTRDTWQQIGVTLLEDRGKLRDRPGAQGCWMSHWGLWNHCAQSGESMIILEHDAIALRSWNLDFSQRSGVIKLFTAGTKTNSITGEWSKGAWAYWICPSAADRLIEHAQAHGAQALDKHLGSAVVDIHYLDPPLFKHDDQRDPSTTSWRSLV